MTLTRKDAIATSLTITASLPGRTWAVITSLRDEANSEAMGRLIPGGPKATPAPARTMMTTTTSALVAPDARRRDG